MQVRQQCPKTYCFPRDILWARFCDIFCAKLTRSCHGLQFSRWFLFPRCPVHIMCVLFILMYNCTFQDQSIHSKPIQSSKLHYSSRTIMCISCHLIVRAEFWLSEQNSFTVHINLLLHNTRPDNLQVLEAVFLYLSQFQNVFAQIVKFTFKYFFSAFIMRQTIFIHQKYYRIYLIFWYLKM